MIETPIRKAMEMEGAPKRLINALAAADVRTVEDFLRLSIEDLYGLRGIGPGMAKVAVALQSEIRAKRAIN